MITGYMDENDNFFCADCWKKASAVVAPASILDTVDPESPDDPTPFWVIDKCVLCGVDECLRYTTPGYDRGQEVALPWVGLVDDNGVLFSARQVAAEATPERAGVSVRQGFRELS